MSTRLDIYTKKIRNCKTIDELKEVESQIWNDRAFFRESTRSDIWNIRTELGKKMGSFDGENYLD